MPNLRCAHGELLDHKDDWLLQKAPFHPDSNVSGFYYRRTTTGRGRGPTRRPYAAPRYSIYFYSVVLKHQKHPFRAQKPRFNVGYVVIPRPLRYWCSGCRPAEEERSRGPGTSATTKSRPRLKLLVHEDSTRRGDARVLIEPGRVMPETRAVAAMTQYDAVTASC